MSNNSIPKLICFDLEGPLSPQDNAYEIIALIPNGHEIFEIISFYDDILTIEEKPGYEPGDTLSLIVPFLIHHKIDSEKIKAVSETAKIVDGAADLVSWLKSDGWRVKIISTSYSQHAYTIGEKIGVGPEDIACTDLKIDEMIEIFSKIGTGFISEFENELMAIYPPNQHPETVKTMLDDYYWSFLPHLDLGTAIRSVEVMGGIRKLDAAESFARALNLTMNMVTAVGDSITDFKMLEGIKGQGGLAVAFNSNEYALPYASAGLASTSLYDLKPLLEGWKSYGIEGAKQVAEKDEDFQWIDDLDNTEEALDLHKKYRKLVRGEASKLG